ncbi:MAG: DUF2007 domain-containing protein [Bacteroidetes bacterium]|nr:DUF2007 domain-containing protein [Bacteroidota bacterium]
MEDNLITIAVYSYPTEAYPLMTHLRNEGIECFLGDENIHSVMPYLTNSVGGVKVNIWEKDLEKAELILKELEQGKAEDNEIPEEEWDIELEEPLEEEEPVKKEDSVSEKPNKLSFATFLKEQLTDFVECYKNYYSKTFWITLMLSVLCFICYAFLNNYFGYDDTLTEMQSGKLIPLKDISLGSRFIRDFFYPPASTLDKFTFLVFTKNIFYFFCAAFSIFLLRAKDKKNGISFNGMLQSITTKDFVLLLAVLAIACGFKYGMIYTNNYLGFEDMDKYWYDFPRNIIHLLTGYVSPVLFAWAIYYLTSPKKHSLTFKKILFLYVSIWLFVQFSYGFESWCYTYFEEFLGLITPRQEEYRHLINTLVNILLIQFFFLGFYSAFTKPLLLTEEPTTNPNLS